MRPLRPYEIKPHGSYEPKPERGAYLRREPKGDPDVLLFSFPDGEREKFLDWLFGFEYDGLGVRTARLHECRSVRYLVSASESELQ